MTSWYPVMLNVSGKLCVVFGGGAVAERKCRGLLDAGARVRVVSPRITPGLDVLLREARVEWLRKEAEHADVLGAALVFAATDHPEANRRIASAARAMGIPVNLADDGETGDFVLPAVLRRGAFVLTASLSGAGPALPSRIVRELAGRYGPEYADFAEMLRLIRATVKSRVADPDERRRLLTAAAADDALQEWHSADWLSDPERLLARLRSRAEATPDKDEM